MTPINGHIPNHVFQSQKLFVVEMFKMVKIFANASLIVFFALAACGTPLGDPDAPQEPGEIDTNPWTEPEWDEDFLIQLGVDPFGKINKFIEKADGKVNEAELKAKIALAKAGHQVAESFQHAGHNIAEGVKHFNHEVAETGRKVGHGISHAAQSTGKNVKYVVSEAVRRVMTLDLWHKIKAKSQQVDWEGLKKFILHTVEVEVGKEIIHVIVHYGLPALGKIAIGALG